MPYGEYRGPTKREDNRATRERSSHSPHGISLSKN